MAVSALSVSAQESAQAGDTAKAIKELTGEIRTLRAAIERTGESQLQGQILGLYLSLQQNRVAQANARVDTMRRELDGVVGHAREVAQEAADNESALAQETDPARRRAFEQQLRASKQALERMAAQEQQVRSRELEAYQTAQTEEQRWTELIGRLEQLLKK
jgi:hypothetical protein